MKLIARLSALGAVVVLAATFASADTLNIASYAQDGGNGGNNNTNLITLAAPSFAVNNGYTNYAPSPLNGETQYLTVTNTSVWNLPVGNSSWVSYSQTGPQSSPFYSTPNGNYFFSSTFDIGTTDPTLERGYLYVQADDTLIAFLNGIQLNVPTGTSYPHCSNGVPTCTEPTLINLAGLDFISGVNTLTFQVTQAAGADFGLNFDGAVTPVPEPGSLLLLGTGLIGSAGAFFRRMRA